ncbi:hypothetical protein [Sulfitobacter aestuariivivens]|uniref:Uncharacterized protein n=1 Tax=Sulfitobacter aestuariivivens TaxID=2766981 RepID=A0A927HDM0_9RHOB|nr:hypothetical protein [Sulfitobacter aestuariivivens]MBD3662439.1 hypothetical protein [Sulfitobacter aestuariivivens]
MSEETFQSGRGSQRGIIIAVVALAIFVIGVAMLGNGSTPDDAATATGSATSTD